MIETLYNANGSDNTRIRRAFRWVVTFRDFPVGSWQTVDGGSMMTQAPTLFTKGRAEFFLDGVQRGDRVPGTLSSEHEVVGLGGTFKLSYVEPTIFNRRVLTRLYRQPLHRWLHQYYVLVPAITIASLWLLSPLVLVFCYLAPLGWLHIVGSAHQVFAHGKDGPRDQRWLEWVLFTGGEWLHGHHHDRQRGPRFGKSDLGYHFIRLISNH